MLEIGSTIQANVARKEPYGVYLQHNGYTILVLAPELAWRNSRKMLDTIHLGDEMEVHVLLRNYQNGEYSGSFRRLHPEDNPYRELSRLETGTGLQGKVTLVAGDEVTVTLADGTWGHIPNYKLQRLPKVGEEIEVVISSLLVDEGLLWLEPAKENDRTQACQIKVQVPQLVS